MFHSSFQKLQNCSTTKKKYYDDKELEINKFGLKSKKKITSTIEVKSPNENGTTEKKSAHFLWNN